MQANEATFLTRRERAIYAALSLSTGEWLPARATEIFGRLDWSADRFLAFRLERCRRVLLEAGRWVPYYRRLFAAAGFDPQSFRSFDQLRMLPVLDRATLRSCFAELQHEHISRPGVFARTTGGTTGVPVKVMLERRHNTEKMLITHRMYRCIGRHLGDPTLLIAGSPIDFHAWTSFRERLKNTCFHISVTSSFHLDRTRLSDIVARLETGRYKFVIAYSSVFDILCSHLQAGGRTLRVPGIIPCAELVTATQRERWQQVLGAEVFEIYGSREMVTIAGETPAHQGLVVNGDLYYVEILDDSGRPVRDGEPGLITITSLLETAMPLLRYQLGDIGVISRQNGAFHQLLRITHGRVLDVIRTPQGKMLPGEFFPHLMKEVSAEVERFQLIQNRLDALTLKIVRTSAYSSQTTEYLTARIAEQVGRDVNLTVQFVDSIATSPSGKYRPTISLLSGPGGHDEGHGWASSDGSSLG